MTTFTASVAVALLVIVPLCAEATSSAAVNPLSDAFDFAATTTIITHGNQVVRLRLPHDAEMIARDIETNPDVSYAGMYIWGPSNSWMIRVGNEWFGGEPGLGAGRMRAGDYEIYLVSSDSSRMVTEFLFNGLDGAVEIEAREAVSAAIAPLAPVGLDTPWLHLQSFSGTRTMPSTTIAGFLVYEAHTIGGHTQREEKWQSNGRTVFCFAQGEGIVGGAWVWISSIMPDVVPGTITLTYYTQIAGGPTELEVYGLWIGRVGTQSAGVQSAQPHGQADPRGLDQDAACARPSLEYILGGI